MGSTEEIDAIVICTYRRNEDLRRCLESIYKCSDRPSRILIVDGESDHRLESFLSRYFPEVEYFASPAGLTRQRNLALAKLKSVNIVYFLDDDTEVFGGYFKAVKELFKTQDVIGVGITPLPHHSVKIHLLARALGQISNKPGKVTRGGFNVGRYSGSGYADWLPGCSMSYLFNQIGESRFDERRAGYGLGEDVDFSLKMSAKGKLFWASNPLVIHHLSQVNRHDRSKNVRDSIRHRWTLALDNRGRVYKRAVILSTLGQALFWIATLFRWRSLVPLTYIGATLLGLLDLMRKGGLK